MADTAIPKFKTPQELEQAIQQYRSSEWNGVGVFSLWEAIRLSALDQANLSPLEQANLNADDRVPGEDSY